MSAAKNDSKPGRHLIKVASHEQAFFCDEQQLLLDAGLQANLKLPHSCRGGNCGSCLATIRQGDYTYQSDVIPAGISADQRRAGGALMCQIQPRSAMVIDIPRAQSAGSAVIQQLPVRIESRKQVAQDVMQLKLRMPRARPLEFKPGQYLDVLLERSFDVDSVGSGNRLGSPRRRSYSMANVPGAQTLLELHIRRVAGGAFSDPLFADELESSLLKIEGPFGTFGWRSTDAKSVLIASGTGFAPIKAMMLDELAHDRDRPLSLIWRARDAQDFYDLASLRAWREQFSQLSITLALPSASAHSQGVGQHQDVEQGRDLNQEPGLKSEHMFDQGEMQLRDFNLIRTDPVSHVAQLASDACDYYVCGSPRFVTSMRAGLEAQGVSEVYCDSFDPASV